MKKRRQPRYNDPVNTPDDAASNTYDVAVVGAGPAGSAAATFLARAGHRVALFEKDAHPRFHIGESMLPNSLPILERLGVLEQVRAIGLRKNGAEFTCESPPHADPPLATQVQTFRFDRALGTTPSHAFEVRRADFDRVLFDNARVAGATAFERCQVTSVDRLSTHRQRLTFMRYDKHDDSATESIEAAFVLDATGRDTLLARRNGWLQRSKRHASAAVFGHFRNLPRRPGEDAGNISIYWFEHGWLWMIPLDDPTHGEVMSVGAVCWPDYLRKQRSTVQGNDLEAILRGALALSPAAAARCSHAELISPVRSEGNYSYRSRCAYVDGQHLIGDAFAFLDPVFSSGVYLALASAEQCVPVVEAWLAKDLQGYRRLRRQHRRAVTRRMSTFAWFIYRFTTPAMRDLFREPRNDLQIEQAVISVLAGDGDGSFAIRSRVALFKLLYLGYRLKRSRPALEAWLRRRRNLAAAHRSDAPSANAIETASG